MIALAVTAAIWSPVPVVGPVDPVSIESQFPYHKKAVSEGAVVVPTGRAIAVHVPSISLRRVTVKGGGWGDLRWFTFSTTEDGNQSFGRAEFFPAPGWLMSTGEKGRVVYAVAQKTVTVQVEEARDRSGVFAWKRYRKALFDWVDKGTPHPDVKFSGSEWLKQLALADAAFPEQYKSLRKQLALGRLWEVAKYSSSMVNRARVDIGRTQELSLQNEGAVLEKLSGYSAINSNHHRFPLKLSGEGVLQVDVRPLRRNSKLSVVIERHGKVWSQQSKPASFSPVNITSLTGLLGDFRGRLVTKDGAPVGRRWTIKKTLRDTVGKTHLTVKGGPALVRVRWSTVKERGGLLLGRYLSGKTARLVHKPQRCILTRSCDKPSTDVPEEQRLLQLGYWALHGMSSANAAEVVEEMLALQAADSVKAASYLRVAQAASVHKPSLVAMILQKFPVESPLYFYALQIAQVPNSPDDLHLQRSFWLAAANGQRRQNLLKTLWKSHSRWKSLSSLKPTSRWIRGLKNVGTISLLTKNVSVKARKGHFRQVVASAPSKLVLESSAVRASERVHTYQGQEELTTLPGSDGFLIDYHACAVPQKRLSLKRQSTEGAASFSLGGARVVRVELRTPIKTLSRRIDFKVTADDSLVLQGQLFGGRPDFHLMPVGEAPLLSEAVTFFVAIPKGKKRIDIISDSPLWSAAFTRVVGKTSSPVERAVGRFPSAETLRAHQTRLASQFPVNRRLVEAIAGFGDCNLFSPMVDRATAGSIAESVRNFRNGVGTLRHMVNAFSGSRWQRVKGKAKRRGLLRYHAPLLVSAGAAGIMLQDHLGKAGDLMSPLVGSAKKEISYKIIKGGDVSLVLGRHVRSHQPPLECRVNWEFGQKQGAVTIGEKASIPLGFYGAGDYLLRLNILPAKECAGYYRLEAPEGTTVGKGVVYQNVDGETPLAFDVRDAKEVGIYIVSLRTDEKIDIHRGGEALSVTLNSADAQRVEVSGALMHVWFLVESTDGQETMELTASEDVLLRVVSRKKKAVKPSSVSFETFVFPKGRLSPLTEAAEVTAVEKKSAIGAQLSAGIEDFGDDEILSGFRSMGTLAARYLLRPSLRVAGHARVRQFDNFRGYELSSILQGARARWRGELKGRVNWQDVGGGLAGSGRLSGKVNYYLPVGRFHGLLPTLRLEKQWYSLSSLLGVSLDELDPLVYSGYGRAHDQFVEASLLHYYLRFWDNVVTARFSVRTNADLVSVESVSAGARLLTFFERSKFGRPLIDLSYKYSFRPADLHRTSNLHLHDVGARALWWLWTKGNNRLSISAKTRLRVSGQGRTSLLFSIGAKFYFIGSRTLEPLLPVEVRNQTVEEGRMWQ